MEERKTLSEESSASASSPRCHRPSEASFFLRMMIHLKAANEFVGVLYRQIDKQDIDNHINIYCAYSVFVPQGDIQAFLSVTLQSSLHPADQYSALTQTGPTHFGMTDAAAAAADPTGKNIARWTVLTQ